VVLGLREEKSERAHRGTGLTCHRLSQFQLHR